MSTIADRSNQSDEQFRRETLNGEEYLVAPTVAIREGVYLYPRANGRGIRREFLPEDEIANSADDWEGVPLTLSHPVDSDGNPGLVTNSDTTETVVGKFRNVKNQDDALVGETWILADEVGEHDGRLEGYVNAVDNGLPQEVSTGYRSATEFDRGKYNHQRYTHVQRDPEPDHLALLTNEDGNCSVDDGCGAGQTLNSAPSDGVRVNQRRATENAIPTELGVIEDARGRISLRDQTSDGTSVVVSDAYFADTDYFVSIHQLGTRDQDVGPGLSRSIGDAGPYEANEMVSDIEVELDSQLREDTIIFAVLRYSENGEMGDYVTASRNNHYLDSAFTSVVGEDVDLAGDGVFNVDSIEASQKVIQHASEPSGVVTVDEGSSGSDTATTLLGDIRAKMNQLVDQLSSEEPQGDAETEGTETQNADDKTMQDGNNSETVEELVNEYGINEEVANALEGTQCAENILNWAEKANSDETPEEEEETTVNETDNPESDEETDRIAELESELEDLRSQVSGEDEIDAQLREDSDLSDAAIDGMDVDAKKEVANQLGLDEEETEEAEHVANMAGIPQETSYDYEVDDDSGSDIPVPGQRGEE